MNNYKITYQGQRYKSTYIIKAVNVVNAAAKFYELEPNSRILNISLIKEDTFMGVKLND